MKKPSILNYVLPLIMITIGIRHHVRHGMDLMTIIPIVLGIFALYMVLFNHLLLQRVETILIKLWYPMGQLITMVLLTVTFYLVFAPIGLVLRIFKKDILDKSFKVDRLSYWINRPVKQPNHYTQQF